MKKSKPLKNMHGKSSNNIHWSKYDVTWNKLIRTSKYRSRPNTSGTHIGTFIHVHGRKHDFKDYMLIPSKSNSQKNGQFLKKDCIICLFCLKSGHFAHECPDYNPKARQSISEEPSSKILPSNVTDTSAMIYNTNEDDLGLDHELETKSMPIVLLKKSTNLSSTPRNQMVGKEVPTSLSTIDFVNIYHLKEPILFNKDPMFFNKKNHKTYPCSTNYDYLLEAKNETIDSKSNYVCSDYEHPLRPCSFEHLYTNSNQEILKPCKIIQTCAQMSFRIKGCPQFCQNAHLQSNETNQCEEHQSLVQGFNQIDNNTGNDDEAFKNNIIHKYNHKVLEVDYNQLLNSKSKDFRPIINLCEYEQSVALVCGKINGVETTMLLDTGSSISAITEDFAQQLKLASWYTNDVLVVTLANTRVEKYRERKCVVNLEISDFKSCEEFDVLPGQIYNVTLGKNWLKAHMAICDYGLDILRLPNSRPIRMGFPTPTRLKSALKKKL